MLRPSGEMAPHGLANLSRELPCLRNSVAGGGGLARRLQVGQPSFQQALSPVTLIAPSNRMRHSLGTGLPRSPLLPVKLPG